MENIEEQLIALKRKHYAHQQLMDWQKLKKVLGRERHRSHWLKYKPTPITFV